MQHNFFWACFDWKVLKVRPPIQYFEKGYLQLFVIQALIFNHSSNILSSKSDQILSLTPLFGTQLYEYLNISNYSF